MAGLARVLARVLTLCTLLGACSSGQQLPPAPAGDAIDRETEHQRQQALQQQHEREFRLGRVARPLLIAALELCPERQRNDYGLRLHSLSAYAPAQHPAARALYQLDRQPTLRTPLPGSPAARAGLRAGDRLMRLQGRAVKSDNDLLKMLQEAAGPLRLEIARGDDILALSLTPDKLCDWPIQLSRSSAINAYADGQRIRVTQAMLGYAAQDDELAMVIAHELAHNGLQHMSRQLRNLMLGALIDLLALTQGYPSPGIAATLGIHQQALNLELEADLQALVLLHRAGIALAPGVAFWRRLGTDFPASIRHSRGLSHPGTAERYLRMQSAAQALQPGEP
ncbi:M48 family metalloprotease [Marinobacterium rhizophilum]|uniref:M48 family metalloprotease n=1 Tax=Marinobacterium rhizophilum TaxID=420402 RepID=A0ABY5HN77_9GAMM|nr:M48 family metallopeptidase [Marinobacterium rhizophilum]UTW13394.1 M48 family metalloprotease [Marinobacterium rhizophilum]